MDKKKFKNSIGGIRGDVGEKFKTERDPSNSDYKKRPTLQPHHRPVKNDEMDVIK